METSVPGVFACGNVLHVHDLADYVTVESQRAGKAAARFVLEGAADGRAISTKNGEGVVYTVPQKIRIQNNMETTELFFRVNQVFKNGRVDLKAGDKNLKSVTRGPMAPGEMQRIIIPAELLENVTDTLVVSAKEAAV